MARSMHSRTTRPSSVTGRVNARHRSGALACTSMCCITACGPLLGMMMSTWAPGNAGGPSFKGTSSSHLGTIAMRAVPLRIAILPSSGRDSGGSGEPLAAARIAEPAHALDQRGLEWPRPPSASQSACSASARGNEDPTPAVRHRDHDHPLCKLAAPVVRLHRQPSRPCPRVLQYSDTPLKAP